MTWLTDTLIATGALILLVLVLRRPMARLFGPNIAYALWALPLLRLGLPPLVLPQRAAEPVEPMALAAEGSPSALVAAPDAAVTVSLFEMAVAVWLAGAIAFTWWRISGYREMRRRLLSDARPVGEIGKIRLVETPHTAAPVAFGVRDKVIALPPRFMAQGNRRNRDLAIAHEFQHHNGRDLAVNLAMQPLMALHWFNPLAWLGWRAMRRDQEAACDARVLAGADRATRAAYARLIASFAQSPRMALAAPMACPVLGEASIIHRLRNLTMAEPTVQRRRAGQAAIAAAVVALPLTATITYAASDSVAVSVPAIAATPQAHKVVIIDNRDAAHSDKAALHTRVIERDGETIVWKSDETLSEAEFEKRIERIAERAQIAPPLPPLAIAAPSPLALARVPALPVLPLPPGALTHARAIHFHTGSKAPCDDQHGERVNQIGLDRDAHNERARAAALDRMERREIDRELAEARAEAHASMREARSEALAGLREARAEIVSDHDIPDRVRADVLKGLDAEIERLSGES